MLRASKKSDTERGRPNNITVEDIRAVWPADNRCRYCGVEMATVGERKNNPLSPSLDEVVYGLGHVKGNIAIVCYACNGRKGAGTPDWLRNVAGTVFAFQHAQKETVTQESDRLNEWAAAIIGRRV